MTTSLNQENLLKQLNAIGLHDTDAQVYLASIRMGACTIGQLTTQTKINRITVHDCVGRLIERGLLLETFSGKRRLVYPQQINQLQHLVDTKKAEIDQLQLNVTKTINILQSLHLQSDYLPHMRISKGRQGISDMIREIKEYKDGPLLTVSDSRHFDELLNVHFLDSLTHFAQPIQMILPA
jgi:sugar-specific transcriptional regulator TrmB